MTGASQWVPCTVLVAVSRSRVTIVSLFSCDSLDDASSSTFSCQYGTVPYDVQDVCHVKLSYIQGLGGRINTPCFFSNFRIPNLERIEMLRLLLLPLVSVLAAPTFRSQTQVYLGFSQSQS